jgi:hypothetical protein
LARAASDSRTAAALLLTTVAGQLADQLLDQLVAVAASGAVDVVFEIAGRAHRQHCLVDGLLRQQCPAEIGVQNRAGQVEHRPQTGPGLRCEDGRHFSGNLRYRGDQRCGAALREGGAYGIRRGYMAELSQQRGDKIVAQDPVD